MEYVETIIGIILEIIMIAGIIVGIVLIIKDYILKKEKREFVQKNGITYLSVLELGKKYRFWPVKTKHSIHHCSNSKRSLDNLDLSELLIYYIENNFYGIRDNIENILKNIKIINHYNNEYCKIANNRKVYSNNILLNSKISSLQEFYEIENELIKSVMLKYYYFYNINVYAYYTSPQGRNNWSKRYNYNVSEIISLYNTYLLREEYKETAQFQRSLMTSSLRYDVLKRDGFRCQICGATQADGVKLEVDHIIPISKGGKTKLNNLQTLCYRCNRGKSNKL